MFLAGILAGIVLSLAIYSLPHSSVRADSGFRVTVEPVKVYDDPNVQEGSWYWDCPNAVAVMPYDVPLVNVHSGGAWIHLHPLNGGTAFADGTIADYMSWPPPVCISR
jgi:hypothetical protein